MATSSWYPGNPVGLDGSSPSDPEKRKEYAKRSCQNDLRILKRDFLNDLPEYIRNVMCNVECRWDNEPWFEEAWNKYRDHVLESIKNGTIPKGPGVVFNDYINDAIDEDFLEAEQKSVLHSDLPVKDIEEIMFNDTIYLEPIIMHDGLSQGKKNLYKGHDSIIDLLISKKCGNISVNQTETTNQNK